MQERLQERIEYYECYEKIRTQEVIEDLKQIKAKLTTESKPQDEKVLVEYLKSQWVKGAHLFRWEKLLAKAKELWYD